jgi:LysR family glycine cleavage system transcriptional activator
MPETSRRLPSLNALRAFEAAARHQSFTKAADELSVTQGAVSHHIKALEAELGVPLFHRSHHGLALTAAGQTYLPVLRDAFDRLAFGTKQLLAVEQVNRLTISVTPNFAAKWLVPRLGQFIKQHPELDLRIGAKEQHVDFAVEDIDLAVRHGLGDWPDLHVTKLTCEELFPVCSPRLLECTGLLRRPADLRHATLLHLNDREDWQKWLNVAGVGDIDLSRGVVFDQASLALEAAADGQGVALARTTLATGDLLAGRLVRPFACGLMRNYSYFIVCPSAFAERPKIKATRNWLLKEAASDRERLKTLWLSLNE